MNQYFRHFQALFLQSTEKTGFLKILLAKYIQGKAFFRFNNIRFTNYTLLLFETLKSSGL